MKNYNFELAKRIIDKLFSLGVLKEAALGMHEDWWWTADTVFEEGEYIIQLNNDTLIGGIKGSRWATPVLQVTLQDETVKTFSCFDGETNLSVEDMLIEQNIWASGCISGEVQENRFNQDIEEWQE